MKRGSIPLSLPGGTADAFSLPCERVVAMSDFGFARATILSDQSLFNAYVYFTVSIHPKTGALHERAHQAAAAQSWKRPPGQPLGAARPGVVINWRSSALECRDAVACSEVRAFRYEPALDPVEQETAEHGTSVRYP